jgi:tetratricopeptide (TPR) repeat protein
MTSNRSIAILCLLVLPAGFAGIWRLQHSIDGQLTALNEEQDEVLLRSGKMIKLLSLEYAPLMADIYWTRVVQYYGSKGERREQNLEGLWPLLDLSTTLDPNLIPAYRFGSTFLAEARPVGAGTPERAIELIERGIRANPEYWRLYQDLGNIYYFSLRDNEKAAAAYEQGSRVSGAMPWMKIMAARIAERGDKRQTSRLLWTEIFQSARESNLRENAKTHLMLLKTDDDKEQLDRLLGEYAKKSGRPAVRLSDLVNAGILSGVPVDPDGFPYVIGKTGHAELNPKSPLFELEPLYRRF